MSNDTDMALGAGALYALQGLRDKRETQRANEAYLARMEGLTRLQQRIGRENSESGWVQKGTGRPILNSELDNYSQNELMSAGDYAFQEAQRVSDYTQKQKLDTWKEQERIRQKNAMDLAKTKGMYDLLKTGGKQKDEWAVTPKDQDILMEAYKAYKESPDSMPTTEGGFLGFGEKEVAPKPFDANWIKENYQVALPAYMKIQKQISQFTGGQPGAATTGADQGGQQSGDVVQPQPMPIPGEAQASTLDDAQAGADRLRAEIDALRGEKEGEAEAPEKPETVKPTDTGELSDKGLLEQFMDQQKEIPKEERDKKKAEKEYEEAKKFILKNMPPQQKAKFYKMSKEEQKAYIDKIIAARKR